MNPFSEQGRFERYRLLVISSWPEGNAKKAALQSARAALERELAFMRSRLGDAPNAKHVTG